MITGIFLITFLIQISISLLGGIGGAVNLPLVLGVLFAVRQRSGRIPLEIYLLVVGIVLDIASAVPLGVFAISFFITFLIIRFFLQFIHRETIIVTGVIVFLGSILFRIIQQVFLLAAELMGGTVGSSLLSASGGFLGMRDATLAGRFEWIAAGASADFIIAQIILGTLFVAGRYVFPLKQRTLDQHVSPPKPI